MKIISTLLGLSAVGLAFAQAGAKPIATINGKAISSAEYYHRMEHLTGVYAAYAERLVEVAPGLITLDRMITERATLQLAEDHNVAPTQAEIDAAYASRLASNPTMEKDALASGLTVADLKYQVAIDLSRFKLLTEGTLVTDQEVLDNYKNHPDRYMTPKLVDMRVIVVDNDADKAAVDADLAAGKDFAAVASARSLDVTKIRGGLIAGASFDSLDQAIRDALSAIKIGEETAWIRVPNQAAGGTLVERILYVRATAPTQIKLDATLREEIRRQMMMELGSVRNNVAKEVSDTLAKAKVDITDPAFAKAWQDLRAKALSGSATKPAG
ncbi:MAG: peptidyl-prolyl cis-trans isomerase [Fimbriimonadaceae bacterium]